MQTLEGRFLGTSIFDLLVSCFFTQRTEVVEVEFPLPKRFVVKKSEDVRLSLINFLK